MEQPIDYSKFPLARSASTRSQRSRSAASAAAAAISRARALVKPNADIPGSNAAASGRKMLPFSSFSCCSESEPRVEAVAESALPRSDPAFPPPTGLSCSSGSISPSSMFRCVSCHHSGQREVTSAVDGTRIVGG